MLGRADRCIARYASGGGDQDWCEGFGHWGSAVPGSIEHG